MNELQIIVVAVLYGVTMKIADLLNEHGLRWFKCDAALFGLLWGGFGSLLVLSNPVVATAIVAQNVAYIVRGRLDYWNHQLAATMIISSAFGLGTTVAAGPFMAFVAFYAVLGTARDYDTVLVARGIVPASVNELFSLYYPISGLVYCSLFGDWNLFWVLTAYIASYDAVKIIAKRRGYP